MYKILFCLMLSTVLASCKPQEYSFQNLPEKRLVFGNGGGVTGASNTYVLLENGQLFRTNSLTRETNELRSIPKREARECFRKLDGLSLSEMDFKHPGNRYYFLEEVNGETKNRVVWGSQDYKVSNECQELYNRLRTTLK